MHRSTAVSAVLLGIVAVCLFCLQDWRKHSLQSQVYGIGVYPIVLEEHIDWAESAVALGSLIQARAPSESQLQHGNSRTNR